jgi:hypothetical protein
MPGRNERGAILATATRWFVVVLIAVSIDWRHCALGQESAPTEIKEAFDGRDYDRMRWSLNNTSVAITKVDFSKKTIRLVIPPAQDKRPLMGIDSRFGLEGDFDISVDYLIHSLPRPAKEWVNLSIFIIGPDGMAAMIRTNNSASGEGYSIWFQPWEGSKAKGIAKNEPTQDKAGTLRLARIGKQLWFYASARGQPHKEIGNVEFGDRPIDTVGFQVFAPALKSAIDIEYDNIAIRADRFTKLVYVPRSENSYVFWALAGLAAVAVIFLLWWWIFRHGR